MLTPAEILGPQGRIAARLEHYEQRPEQLAMAEAVATAIRDKHHLIAEAGTGVGKSFAYLVPAILAVAQGQTHSEDAPERRVIISTHTISLQEQLIHKDLPLLNSVIPLEFAAVLVKGRHNYLSLRRMKLASSRATSLFAATRNSPSCDRWSIGRVKRPTGRYRISTTNRWRKSGTKSKATAAIAWAGNVRRTRNVSIIGLAAACRTRKSWSSTTRCSSATWLCAARAPASCPTTTS